MSKNISYMITAGLLAAFLLAGCSSTSTTAATTNTSDTTASNTSAQTESSQDGSTAETAPDQNGGGMDMQGMTFAKIKSISGSTITVYTAEMPGGDGGGQRPEGGQDQGTPPSDAPSGDQSQQGTPPSGAPSGDQAQQGQDGQGPQGNMGGGGGMMQSFSEETTDITVGSDTKIVSVSYDNGSMQETEISLSDLKADDVIQYTLKSDSTEAEQITLSTGGFGGGMPGEAPADGGNGSTGDAGTASSGN